MLSARPLANYVNVNTFDYATEIQFTQGDSPTLYFQLLDKSKDKLEDRFYPSGRRYVPVTGATLKITLRNIDDAKVISRFATAVTTDTSIWSLAVMSTDPLVGTVNITFTLTESGKVTTGTLQAALVVSPKDNVNTAPNIVDGF